MASRAKAVLGSRLKTVRHRHALAILNQSIDTMQRSLTQYRLGGYAPDYLIEIPKNSCAVFDFHQAEKMIALGHRAAESLLERIE